MLSLSLRGGDARDGESRGGRESNFSSSNVAPPANLGLLRQELHAACAKLPHRGFKGDETFVKDGRCCRQSDNVQLSSRFALGSGSAATILLLARQTSCHKA